MIIFGNRSSLIAQERITDNCKHCGTANSITMFVFQKYGHVFWLPFFPTGKTYASQCDHCKQVLPLRDMPPSFKGAYENVKANAKTPLWTWSGVGIILVISLINYIVDMSKGS